MAWADINPTVQQPRQNIPNPNLDGVTQVDPYWYGASAILPSGMPNTVQQAVEATKTKLKGQHINVLVVMVAFGLAAIVIHRMATGGWSIVSPLLIGVAGGVGVEIVKNLAAMQEGAEAV
jgi:hypothetical protein